MNVKRLKPLRVVISSVVLIFSSILFLDFYALIPASMQRGFLALQFLPSLVNLTNGITYFSVGVLIVVALTVLFGRVYCSTLCPLGVVQDVIIHAANRFKGRRRFRFARPKYWLHYVLLLAGVIGFFAGSMILIDALEPFSNYGRMMNDLARPAAILTQNTFAWLIGIINPYAITPIVAQPPVWTALGISSVILLAIVYLSWQHGRLFCNLLCPAGALLGLISRVSLFKITIDKPKCTGCGLCEKVCKAQCIQTDDTTIEFSACVSCFNCMTVCPSVGVAYASPFRPTTLAAVEEEKPRRIRRARKAGSSKPLPSTGRRTFVRNIVGSLAGVVGVSAVVGSTAQTQALPLDPVTPPGSLGRDHFTSKCTACHLCVSVCPTHVLSPSLMDYGVEGILQPRMNYAIDYCNYDCTLCSEVCPSGAILPVSMQEKKQIQIGKVTFVKDDCIVISKKKDCGACSEHCPTKAVKMIPYENRFLPEISNEYCVGCGACEHACPVVPKKAIYVQANPVHAVAKTPPTKSGAQKKEILQEFPF